MKKFLAFVFICLFLVSLTFFSPQALANTSSDLPNSSSPVLPTEDFSLTTPIPTVGYTVVQQEPQERSSREDISSPTDVLGQQTVKSPFALNNYFSVLSRVSFFVILIILAAILVEVLVVSGRLRKKPQILNTSVTAVRSTPVANSLARPLSQGAIVPNAVQGSSGVNVLASTPSPSIPAGQAASGQTSPSVFPTASVSTPLASLPPLPKKEIDKKTIGIALLILFLLVTIPLALFLVSQRQEIRKKAYINDGWASSTCPMNGGAAPGDIIKVKVVKKTFNTKAECDALCCDGRDGIKCGDIYYCGQGSPYDMLCTVEPGKDKCTVSIQETCGVVQTDCAEKNGGSIAWSCSGCPEEVTPTPTPTEQPTPTPTIPLNTPTPTITGAPTATPTPTGRPTATPTPTGRPTATPTPTIIPGCGQRQCTTNADCPADFPYCFDRPSDNIAIKVCVINTSWYDGCETWSCAEKRCTVGSVPNGCPSSYPVCASIAEKGEVCVINASWSDGCTSLIAQATPTIAVPPIPNAAFELPAVLSVVGGIILLVLGVLL